MMFKDYPHKNEVILFNKKNYLQKTLASQIVLQKEYLVMKFLEPTEIAPRAISYNGSILIEEYLNDWCPIEHRELTAKIIEKIAETLKKLHSLELSEGIIKICKDKYTMDLKYHPFQIFKTIEKVLKSKNVYCNYEKLGEYFITVNERLSRSNYTLSLIHGDLSPNNIMLKGNEIKIVDWSDCRLDIFTADISQLFYLFKFSEGQERLFKDFYGYGLGDLDNSLLLTHKILLVFYDLASDFSLPSGREDKESRLTSLLRQI